jgi:dTDP-4-amino-4,6-dideoxygalactose transaminase
MEIPFLTFDVANRRLRKQVLAYLESFYDGGRYILGRAVEAFEDGYAAFSGTCHCVGVGNGLDALYLSFTSLGIGAGDEVIVPSNTYVATWLAVSRTGAVPVPVEPDAETFNLDPGLLEEAITGRTRAILPVHLFGRACPMTEIMEIASKHGLKVVEDNAQAHGAVWEGRRTGGIGHVNAASFYPTKNLGALGDAGAVTTDDGALADAVRTLRNYGSDRKDFNRMVGVNSRLDELQAGILSIKLEHLDRWNRERRRIAGLYDERLRDVSGVRLPAPAPDGAHVHHLYVVRVNHRDGLRRHLEEQGIGTMVHYPVPPHLQEAYRDLGYRPGDFPIAEELASTSLSLPLFIGMAEEQVHAVARQIVEFMEREQ